MYQYCLQDAGSDIQAILDCEISLHEQTNKGNAQTKYQLIHIFVSYILYISLFLLQLTAKLTIGHHGVIVVLPAMAELRQKQGTSSKNPALENLPVRILRRHNCAILTNAKVFSDLYSIS